VLIVDGTPVPAHDRSMSSKNYRYSVNMQVVMDANTHLVVAVGDPTPGNRRCRNGKKNSTPSTRASAHGWNTPWAHLKSYNTLRNCRRKRDGVLHATRGIAQMWNLAMTA
jgi:hypothetical protein